MNSELRNLVLTCSILNRERKPGEPRHKLPAEAVASYVYDLILPLRMIGDDELSEIEHAIGLDDPDVDRHRIAIAIRQGLEAMHSVALGVYHLLPEEDE